MARSKAITKKDAKDFAESICDDLASQCEGEQDDMELSWQRIREAVDKELGTQLTLDDVEDWLRKNATMAEIGEVYERLMP